MNVDEAAAGAVGQGHALGLLVRNGRPQGPLRERRDDRRQRCPSARSPTPERPAGPTSSRLFLSQSGFAARFDGIAPGGAEQASKLSKISPDGRRTAKLRLREETWPGLVVEGVSDVRRMVAGRTFDLIGHPHANGKYLLVKIDLASSVEGSYTGGGARSRWRSATTSRPSPEPRPTGRRGPRRSRGPRGCKRPSSSAPRARKFSPTSTGGSRSSSSGTATARAIKTVRAGSAWRRRGPGNSGGPSTSRAIGQEVLDRVRGGRPGPADLRRQPVQRRQHAAVQAARDFKTKSGIMSRSTTKGDATTFNELRFEDKKGSEANLLPRGAGLPPCGGEQRRPQGRVRHQGRRQPTRGDFQQPGHLCRQAERPTRRTASQKLDVFNSQTITIGSGKGQAKDGSQKVSVYKDHIVTVILTGDDKLTVDKGGPVRHGHHRATTKHVVKMGNRKCRGHDRQRQRWRSRRAATRRSSPLGSSKTRGNAEHRVQGAAGRQPEARPERHPDEGHAGEDRGRDHAIQMKATIVKVDAERDSCSSRAGSR